MRTSRRKQTTIGAVFVVSVMVSALIVLWGGVAPTNFSVVTTRLFDYVVSHLSWFFLLAANLFLVFVVYLGMSRYGRIKLGKKNDRPDFGRLSWFAMMFQAGMGPSIIFWGLAEPLSHYVNVPFGLAGPGSEEAAGVAVQYSFFHWALHPWAIYATAGLAVAYFTHRKGEKALLSTIFRPLIGDRVDGPVGKTIDILAVLAVVFGIAVALGQAGLQITAGLGQTFGLPTVVLVQLVVLGLTTAAFMVSATTRIEHGIKWLANISMLIAPLLLVFYFVVGPTITQLNVFTEGVGNYLSNLVPMSFRLDAFSPNTEWLGSWTVFYWSWWIAWAPYVGMFMARISRGRSIREFVVATVVVPSVVSMIWIAVFGGAALQLARGGQASDIAKTVEQSPAAGMFVFIQEYPLPILLSIITLVVLWVFFVAGADAGTVVLGELSTGGSPNPTTWVRLLWGLLLAGVAAVLLVSGGLGALQKASVLIGTPFVIILVAICVAFSKTLAKENGSHSEESSSLSEEHSCSRPTESEGRVREALER
ncbi:glycine betaine transporter [Halopolyspora algeriensis]|uniref:Glycine betaine transporter n=1 Tax=Halopolyspora algeriensis TaxID=1500506 RepID=A0A368VUE9_9ACTN|nr:BCCT family transporter [Halopolyspora algeriensis]RCW44703.1 glycine betaine transporter [Halopolyspora algeriensis]TQM56060.1 glycine betaine transporter [Halopolyspora algeriensis]